MAQTGKVGIVGQVVGLEPELAQQRGDERGDHTADIDEDVENLETRVAAALGDFQGFGTFFGGLGLEVVIHLADDGLEVPFEKSVAEGDYEEGEAGEYQNPGHSPACLVGEDRNGEEPVAQGHHQQTGDNRAFVFLGAVGDKSPGEAKHVDKEIEYRVNPAGQVVADTEFGAEEKQQHGVHDIISEPFAHIGDCCRNKTFRVVAARFDDVEH